ncbi:MAG TPA: hypothetical protein DEP72_07645 [Clostridiales bacterium]|nr:MAG: hypothetical protein A2Y18_06990 [Clostridiales bacterium GWD2_32_19]HCC08009.1 hypothetical protein [Clostridiales bacterium]
MMKFIRFIIFDLIVFAIGFTFFLRMTKTVDVEWTTADYENGIKKTKLDVENINDLNLTDVLNDKLICYGGNQVQTVFSSKEMSAMLSTANNELGPISNIKINLLDNNEVEANFTLEKATVDFLKETAKTDPNVGKYVFLLDMMEDTPIYIKGKINSYGKYNIDASVEKIYLGNIHLGSDVVDKVQASLSPFITFIISKYNGLSIEQLYIEKDRLEFIGTLPAKIEKYIVEK